MKVCFISPPQVKLKVKMGCSSSISVQGAGVEESGPELVVVGGQLYDEVDSPADKVTTIDIYNLGR
jgi:hypothetical protein